MGKIGRLNKEKMKVVQVEHDVLLSGLHIPSKAFKLKEAKAGVADTHASIFPKRLFLLVVEEPSAPLARSNGSKLKAMTGTERLSFRRRHTRRPRSTVRVNRGPGCARAPAGRSRVPWGMTLQEPGPCPATDPFSLRRRGPAGGRAQGPRPSQQRAAGPPPGRTRSLGGAGAAPPAHGLCSLPPPEGTHCSGGNTQGAPHPSGPSCPGGEPRLLLPREPRVLISQTPQTGTGSRPLFPGASSKQDATSP